LYVFSLLLEYLLFPSQLIAYKGMKKAKCRPFCLSHLLSNLSQMSLFKACQKVFESFSRGNWMAQKESFCIFPQKTLALSDYFFTFAKLKQNKTLSNHHEG